jgi:hypothetical protein
MAAPDANEFPAAIRNFGTLASVGTGNATVV